MSSILTPIGCLGEEQKGEWGSKMATKKEVRVCVIGLGTIGSAVFRELSRESFGHYRVLGVDKDKRTVVKFKEGGYGDRVHSSLKGIVGDIYIICVYSTSQVLDVIDNLDLSQSPLVSVESTIDMKTADTLESIWTIRGARTPFEIVLFPHRLNPGDKEHQVFNLDRVLGGTSERGVLRAFSFYNNHMKEDAKIHIVSWKIAALAKTVENAYRYVQIAFAEELKMHCDYHNIDFRELREAVNTKWNIEVMETLDGIGGTCLPKDVKLLLQTMPGFEFLKTALDVDEKYSNSLPPKRKNKPPEKA